MLQQYAIGFYDVVVRLENIRRSALVWADGSSKLAIHDREDLSGCLADLRKECETLKLSDTVDRISFIEAELSRKGDNYSCADAVRDLDHLRHSFSTGIKKHAVFIIEPERKKYFQNDDVVAPQVNSAFPLCAAEIKHAGDCYALDQNEACVYYCMCALEVALHVLANELSVTFSGTLDLQNWQNIIENIESEIKKLTNLPSGRYKSDTLKFLSGAAMQFRWFKDAWRNHVMHGRDIYDPGRAFSVFDHVREFMQALADGGLKE